MNDMKSPINRCRVFMPGCRKEHSYSLFPSLRGTGHTTLKYLFDTTTKITWHCLVCHSVYERNKQTHVGYTKNENRLNMNNLPHNKQRHRIFMSTADKQTMVLMQKTTLQWCQSRGAFFYRNEFNNRCHISTPAIWQTTYRRNSKYSETNIAIIMSMGASCLIKPWT